MTKDRFTRTTTIPGQEGLRMMAGPRCACCNRPTYHPTGYQDESEVVVLGGCLEIHLCEPCHEDCLWRYCKHTEDPRNEAVLKEAKRLAKKPCKGYHSSRALMDNCPDCSECPQCATGYCGHHGTGAKA